MAAETTMSLKHLLVTTFMGSLSMFMVIPSIIDLTMAALCPGKDRCSIAIYLSALQQAIIGVGAMVMGPVIGNLSDKYGRKTMLTLPMTLSIIPLTIIAYRRTTNFFYAFFIMKTLTDMISEGTSVSLALAYVADKTSKEQRISAFGILSGVKSLSYVCGTISARLLSTAAVFQVAASMSVLAIVYMRIFLEESIPDRNELIQPILEESIHDDEENRPQLPARNKLLIEISSLREVIRLIMSSTTFSQVARVSFFNSLAEKGMQVSLMYFLKARFHFDKNQFADLMIIDGVAGASSQLLLMPVLTTAIGQEKLLSIGLLASFTNMLLYSIAGSVWVPYALRALSILTVIVGPIIFSIASKQVGPSEQGKAQGCISGINSLANIVSPLVFSPLIALFLSKDAPFDFPGFSILCIALTSLIGFTLSLLIRIEPFTSSQKVNNLMFKRCADRTAKLDQGIVKRLNTLNTLVQVFNLFRAFKRKVSSKSTGQRDSGSDRMRMRIDKKNTGRFVSKEKLQGIGCV